MKQKTTTLSLCALMATALSMHAQTAAPAPAAAPVAATPAAPAPVAMSMPALAGPLAANPKPASFEIENIGKVYVTGVLSAVALDQNNILPGDHHQQADMSNGQVFVQKVDGMVQFFAQAGAYSLPDLGTPYLNAKHTTNDFYGALPQAYLKIAPTDSFSIEAGKLPTLIGAEYTFTFENMNIERGLLWNQENAVNRGVQANFTQGPVAVSVSWNDGFYSNRYNWGWGSVAYTIDAADTISLIGGGNMGKTDYGSLATPIVLNNEQIYNLIYTHTAGQWTITPYLQYTSVKADATLGIAHSAATFGGALLVNYAIPNSKYNIAARAEYISSNGNLADGAPSLIYGPGSKAWSITVTPTYQDGIFFARAEVSYVGTSSTTPGFAFGSTGTKTSQARAMVETGFMF